MFLSIRNIANQPGCGQGFGRVAHPEGDAGPERIGDSEMNDDGSGDHAGRRPLNTPEEMAAAGEARPHNTPEEMPAAGENTATPSGFKIRPTPSRPAK